MGRRIATQVGVSLVEALVALAVMGFGTLAVLGAQSTLRQNSDASRQRSEAVRIAQETLEMHRAYADVEAWQDDVVASGPTAVAVLSAEDGITETSNTTYLVSTQVAGGTGENAPRTKSVRVTVSWDDRTGTSQTVALQSAIQGVPPALAGTLALPRDAGPVRTPRQRHFAIPRQAVLVPNTTTSSFSPPGVTGVTWTFNNLSGVITEICSPVCEGVNRRLLSGYVRFATAVAAPLPADAEVPPGTLLPAGVRVVRGLGVNGNLPANQLTVCAVGDQLGARAYYCAVPLQGGAPWSGVIEVTSIDPVATSMVDADTAKFRVCRYTPVRDSQPLVPAGIRNEQTPLAYKDVGTALTNQNFLVIKAGTSTTTTTGAANTCPADDTSTPLVNGNTWHHQPYQ